MAVHGFVLAGGRSSRMSRDKALLRIEDRTLLETVARRVAEACGEVTIIGPPEVYGGLGFQTVGDLQANHGPLGGIETALALGRADWCLVVACDMPNLTVDLLERLVAAASGSTADCVVAVSPGGRLEPLCAVYGARCLPAVRQALAAGQRKIATILNELQVIHFPLENQREVVNLNTPQDWLSYLAGTGRGALKALK